MLKKTETTLEPPLIEPYGRTIDYVRLSVTDRCDFRCLYCMPKDVKFLPKPEVLSLEELNRIGETLIDLGIKKIRLTGGEPLVRKNIMEVVNHLGALIGKGLDELTITTNASQLERFAGDLYKAGVRRINVSVDTLDAKTFNKISRAEKFDKVMAGIDAGLIAGLKIKINAVALKGVNDHEFAGMIKWCGTKGMDLSLIETMPVGAVDGLRSDQYLPLPKVKQALDEEFTLEKSDHSTAGPSRYYDIKETGRRIGFITPLSDNFCGSCNRIRITCTGQLYMCLGQNDKADLLDVLRSSSSNEPLKAAIREAISRKPEAHNFNKFQDLGTEAVTRNMNVTGG
ncbi:MAG: GTP 3',8-cyclase MoaA [Alphaproteobacteria bacterium]